MQTDELINKANVYELNNALSKVANLHSPEGRVEQQCKHCKRLYPCPTIQAIEKELLQKK